MEDTNFCKGDIDFVLHCIDYDMDMRSFDVDKLKSLKEIIKTDLNIKKDITDDFKRAFLTMGKNDYYEVWGGWSRSFNCSKRKLLKSNSDLVQFAKSKDWKRNYLKDLLVQRMQFDFQTICENYQIPNSMPKWKEKLIKGTEKLNGASFILISNDYSYCYLAWDQRPSKEDQVRKIE